MGRKSREKRESRRRLRHPQTKADWVKRLHDPRGWPKVLYKYGRHCDIESMAQVGQVRIGTLSEYRKREDALRGDPGEGSEHLFEKSPTGRDVTFEELSSFQQDVLKEVVTVPVGGVIIRDSMFSREVFAPDAYVYCTSLELSRAAAGSYDACVRIAYPRTFLLRLTLGFGRHLGLKGLRFVWNPVTYDTRLRDRRSHQDVDRIFLKLHDPFHVEQEYRFAWDVEVRESNTPFRVPEIRDLITMVAIPNPPDNDE